MKLLFAAWLSVRLTLSGVLAVLGAQGECAIMSVMASMTSPEYGTTENYRIKVWFRFVPREGWLPYSTEGIWATRLGEDTARLDNVPFLQEGVAEGDVVRFVTDADGFTGPRSGWKRWETAPFGSCLFPAVHLGQAPRPCMSGWRRSAWGRGLQ